ncbi:hypothetical protein [Coleofasciculus chthonoplastes]|uniref:hypothetical protein n=1 Tax=Coleofasciculus chthonoplastes TaxID=64178 RepID=UPI0032F342B2
MTRQPHDQFAKQYLEELLAPLGTVETDENWGEGVYFLAEFLRTALVAINQLPVSQDTLWLRVLGKRRTQQQAIEELLELPQESPLRRNILEILANWRINVGRSERLSNADRELIMNLSPAYLKWREEAVLEGRQEGRLEGRQEGQRLMVENFLRVRFGEINAELEAIIAPILQLPPEVLTRLLFNLSKQELLLWFGEGSGRDLRLGEGGREKVENLLRVRFGEVDAELADKIAAMLQLPHQQLTPLLLTLSCEELLERFAR